MKIKRSKSFTMVIQFHNMHHKLNGVGVRVENKRINAWSVCVYACACIYGRDNVSTLTVNVNEGTTGGSLLFVLLPLVCKLLLLLLLLLVLLVLLLFVKALAIGFGDGERDFRIEFSSDGNAVVCVV